MTIPDDIQPLDSFDAVLLRPRMYAKDWENFCSFVWGMWHMAENQPRHANPKQRWIGFLKWLNSERLSLPKDWPDAYTRPEKTLAMFREQYTTDEEALREFSACYKSFLRDYTRG